MEARLNKAPGVVQVARFGSSLHVSGTDAAALRATMESLAAEGTHRVSEQPGGTRGGLHLPDGGSAGQFRPRRSMSFSFSRFAAVLTKEFIQMRRDRITFAMMIGLPIIQLLLFGFTINSDARHLPTLVEMDDYGPLSRADRLGHASLGLFRHPGHRCAGAADGRGGAAARATANFVVVFPDDFERDVVRGRRPDILVAADASDPTAVGGAVGGAERHRPDRDGARRCPGPLAQVAPAPPPFGVAVHKQYNPEGQTSTNIVPGLLAIILSMTMVMMTAVAIVKETERGTMEMLIATPVQAARGDAGEDPALRVRRLCADASCS